MATAARRGRARSEGVALEAWPVDTAALIGAAFPNGQFVSGERFLVLRALDSTDRDVECGDETVHAAVGRLPERGLLNR